MRERQRLTTVWIKDTLGPQLEKVCVSASGPQLALSRSVRAGEGVDRSGIGRPAQGHRRNQPEDDG